MAQSIGKVSQIIGPVVDVEFSGENNSLPSVACGMRAAAQRGRIRYQGRHRSAQ